MSGEEANGYLEKNPEFSKLLFEHAAVNKAVGALVKQRLLTKTFHLKVFDIFFPRLGRKLRYWMFFLLTKKNVSNINENWGWLAD